MSNGRRRGFAILIAAVALAFALRALPLYWSSYPSTLDGFDYAWLAKTATETGALPLTQRADTLVFSTYLSVVSLVTDAVPSERFNRSRRSSAGLSVLSVASSLAACSTTPGRATRPPRRLGR
ncbi:hypothetical protein [Haloferax sp. ATB1]|uniref:hypothetical protein n=1 Tax=Haloferax sp. ATB1 TaxID=1508454 RepID=UPI001F520ED0|nr:hypothetical protein [Haloferax sp. ATB1]